MLITTRCWTENGGGCDQLRYIVDRQRKCFDHIGLLQLLWDDNSQQLEKAYMAEMLCLSDCQLFKLFTIAIALYTLPPSSGLQCLRTGYLWDLQQEPCRAAPEWMGHSLSTELHPRPWRLAPCVWEAALWQHPEWLLAEYSVLQGLKHDYESTLFYWHSWQVVSNYRQAEGSLGCILDPSTIPQSGWSWGRPKQDSWHVTTSLGS